MKRIFASLVLIAGLATGSALAQNETPGEGVTIQPAVGNWQSALPIEAIAANLLAELGYTVEDAQSVSIPIFYQTVTQGGVDYWTNGWFPNHNSQLPDGFYESAARVATIIDSGALGGYLVDIESIEEFGITSLEDFKRPEVKEAFDANGDGKADLVACPPGWGCEDTISYHMDAFDLHDHINPITAAYSASFADALARYRNGEPILFYTWTPNYTTVELPLGEEVMWINVPAVDPTPAQEGLEEELTVSGVEGAVTEPIVMGFVPSDIQSVANLEFLDANPAAASLLESLEIPLEDVSQMTVRIGEGESGEDAIDAMAEEWIEQNRDTVDGWLEDARAAAGE